MPSRVRIEVIDAQRVEVMQPLWAANTVDRGHGLLRFFEVTVDAAE